MNSDKVIRVGLLGCGTVGTGLVNLFLEKQPAGIKLETIVVNNLEKPREVDIPNLTTDVSKVIENPSIDVVVELIGGYEPAYSYIKRAIESGKHVVTANKAIISEYGPEIFKLAEKHRVNVGFEGAVAGGIPIINPLLEHLSLGTITSIMGILNGTTNFILTRMKGGEDYETALRLTQKKGFAESDPSFDVRGRDAAYKIAILASLAYGKWIKPDQVYCEGIIGISPIDMEYARELGLVIKLLAIAKKTEGGEIDVRVHPALIANEHQLAKIDDERNALYIQGSPFDELFLVGKGAGQGPTALSVYSDIIKIAELIRSGNTRKIPLNGDDIHIVNPLDAPTEGYLRLYLSHEPGSLHSVLGVLKNYRWNVMDTGQRGRTKHGIIVDGKKYLPDIITHEPLPLGVIANTLSDLEKLPAIHGKPFYMRIER